MKLSPTLRSAFEVEVLDAAHDDDPEALALRACLDDRGGFVAPPDAAGRERVAALLVDLANAYDDTAEGRGHPSPSERAFARRARAQLGNLASRVFRG